MLYLANMFVSSSRLSSDRKIFYWNAKIMNATVTWKRSVVLHRCVRVVLNICWCWCCSCWASRLSFEHNASCCVLPWSLPLIITTQRCCCRSSAPWHKQAWCVGCWSWPRPALGSISSRLTHGHRCCACSCPSVMRGRNERQMSGGNGSVRATEAASQWEKSPLSKSKIVGSVYLFFWLMRRNISMR